MRSRSYCSKESQEFQYCPVIFCIFQWKALQSDLCLSKTEKVQKCEYVLLSIVLFHNIPNFKKKFLVALVSPLERNFKLACTGTCVLSKVLDDMSYDVEQVFTFLILIFSF